MKLFLQVEITGWRPGEMGRQMLNYASSLSSDLMGTDLDSQAEPMIADLVVRLIHQASHVFLFVQASDPNLPPGAAQRVFNELLKCQQKVTHVVLYGDHRSSESTLTGFTGRFHREKDVGAIEELIRAFSKL